MKLNEYFDKYCINKTQFKKKAGISSPTLEKAETGVMISLTTALKISKATEGKVSVEDLIPDHLK